MYQRLPIIKKPVWKMLSQDQGFSALSQTLQLPHWLLFNHALLITVEFMDHFGRHVFTIMQFFEEAS